MARCPERAWFDYLLPGAQANAVERKRMREAPAAEQIPGDLVTIRQSANAP